MPLDPELTEYTTRGPINAVFDFTDFSSGTGFVIYYGGNHSGGYILNSNTFYSEKVMTGAAQNGTTFTKVIDLDFDVLLNIPKIMKGTALISTGVGMKTAGGAAETMSSYIITKIRKWDGSTETEIASGQSSTWADTASAVREVQGYFIVPVVVPETYIAEGESIRVTMELWVKSSQATAGNKWTLTHDPKNRGTSVFDGTNTWDFGTDLTTMEAQLPFRLE